MSIDFSKDAKELKKHKAKDVYRDYADSITGSPTKEKKVIIDLLRRITMLEKRIEKLEKKSK